MIFCASSVVSALLAIAAPVVARYVLSKPELAAPLALGALTIIPQNLSNAAAGALAGLQRVGLSQMIYSWLWPAIFCLVTLVMGTSIPGALILIALSFGSAALIGMGLLGYFLRDMPAAVLPPAEPALPLVGPGLSLFTLELTQLIIASAPAIILGIVASDHSVGLYAVAWRIALVTNITTSGVSSMATPRFAELYGLGDRAGLARAAAQSVGLGVGLALLPSIIMLTAPGLLLGFLGPGYEDGAMTLRILACGLLAATLFTAMPELLGMTGHMASLRRSNLLSLAVLLCLSMLLAPRWTNIGAAIATASAVLVNVAAAAWAVRNHLGITPLSSLYLSVRRWFQEISR
jgi:O-antigen/teichoic acid export membrane protein